MRDTKFYRVKNRSTLDATPRQLSALCISSFKLIAIVTAIIAIALYYISGYEHELFIVLMFVILVPSLISLFAPVIFTTGINWIKIIDLSFHALCVVLAAVGSTLLLLDLDEDEAYQDKRGVELSEVHDKARAAGITGLVLAVLHVLVFIVICCKHRNELPTVVGY